MVKKISDKQKIEELKICSLAQGFGKDLRPLYTSPVINLSLYLQLIEILNGSKLKW